jgi:two-component system cell cycle response regulator DivK
MKKRILIADDKESSRELIRTVLERSGYEILEAQDGGEALARAREAEPDLFVLDLQMPILDGFGVLAELRRDPRFIAIPVVALTASAMPADREKVLGAGFTSYITKPVSLAALRSEVARLLASE